MRLKLKVDSTGAVSLLLPRHRNRELSAKR